jgi:hypothetical protein
VKTLHHSMDRVAENLRMIRPCAAIAETEGTCHHSARTLASRNRLIWRKLLRTNEFTGDGTAQRHGTSGNSIRGFSMREYHRNAVTHPRRQVALPTNESWGGDSKRSRQITGIAAQDVGNGGPTAPALLATGSRWRKPGHSRPDLIGSLMPGSFS